jgi:hypothetical protein
MLGTGRGWATAIPTATTAHLAKRFKQNNDGESPSKSHKATRNKYSIMAWFRTIILAQLFRDIPDNAWFGQKVQ